jgi:hypothetical protein
MEFIKKYSKLLLIASLFVSLSGCKKDAEAPLKNINIDLPGTVSLRYGEQQDISLPENILNAADLKLTLDFTETQNVQISSTASLHDKLTQALTLDQAAGKIHVNSALLYPNNAVSSISGNKLPESYKVTINASSSSKGFEGKQTIEIKVAAANLTIKGLDNKAELPFAYVLYGDVASFELEAQESILAGTTWNIENKSSLGTAVSLNLNQLSFTTAAGDPNKKAEKAYDVVPVLQKDGFNVASRTFRVVFIPKIKFFYGMYYADMDLTILLNSLHIALSNGYISAAPTLYPEKYKALFSITGIEKDTKVFDNTLGILTINETTGSVTVKKNSTLTAGAYKIAVKAVTTTGLEFSTTLTLNMSQAD